MNAELVAITMAAETAAASYVLIAALGVAKIQKMADVDGYSAESATQSTDAGKYHSGPCYRPPTSHDT